MTTVRLNLAALDRIADAAARRGLKTALLAGEARAKAILSQPGQGRSYGKHRASAPGDPPAVDTGRLRNATAADTQLREEGGDIVGRIVANTDYAAALETGTERMAARPYLRPLRDEHADELRAAFVAGART